MCLQELLLGFNLTDWLLCLWEAVKTRQHSLSFAVTSTKHTHDDTCQTQASMQCLLWIRKFSHDFSQFNSLSFLVENNCPKSGVQGHQISSFKSLPLHFSHFCGSKFCFQAMNSCSDQLTWLATEWSQWCAPCCKSSVFISMQACLDWSFNNDTVLSEANTNLTLSQCFWAHQDRLCQRLEESESELNIFTKENNILRGAPNRTVSKALSCNFCTWLRSRIFRIESVKVVFFTASLSRVDLKEKRRKKWQALIWLNSTF